MAESRTLKLNVIQGVVLGVNVYRGYARLCDLAAISKADEYDQTDNPQGTQRSLSQKHARDAYEYVKEKEFAFWPEVFLCARDSKAMKFIPTREMSNFGTLAINLDVIRSNKVAISRVDGNHRLYFADGSDPNYSPIEKSVSFCMAYNLSLEQEISLFVDINDNQKRMSTTHLANIQIRLTEEQELKQKHPTLYIAHKLGEDSKSPLHHRINLSNKKSTIFDIPLGTLRTGLDYMLSRSTQLPLGDIDAQYKLIRNYFSAIKKWQPKAWSNTKDYIMLRGAGLWSICFLGAQVIDLTILHGKYQADDMLEILNSANTKWDWSTNSEHFKGFSGRDGALQIKNKIVKSFSDPNKQSSEDLFQRVLEQD